MRTSGISILLVLFVAVQFSAEAKADRYTAQQWREDCGASSWSSGRCFGYMHAVADHDFVYVAGKAAARGIPIGEAQTICIPEGVTLGQMLEVSRKYTNENPSEWHRPALEVIREALAQTFPCVSSGKSKGR